MIFLSNVCKSRTFSPIETKENKTKVINFLKTVRIWQFRRIFFPFNVWRTQKFLAYLAYPPEWYFAHQQVKYSASSSTTPKSESRPGQITKEEERKTTKKEDKNIM